MATGCCSSSIGWLLKPLSTVASDWTEKRQVDVRLLVSGDVCVDACVCVCVTSVVFLVLPFRVSQKSNSFRQAEILQSFDQNLDRTSRQLDTRYRQTAAACHVIRGGGGVPLLTL